MDFIKLPENSEKLLLELIQADNPVQMLGVRFEQASQRDDDELRGMLRELRERGYINVQWADNVPYYLTLTNSARTYREQLAEYEAQKTAHFSQKKKVSPIIFISHRSTDKAIADMLLDFFSGTGIPRQTVFCSSLPGNDINEKISGEVKTALKKSVVNIAILSTDYYQSAYCLNEAGILWYQDDVPVIPIALPEINSSNMYGFLSNEYKLRRLDSDTDIPYIYDVVSEAVSAPRTKVGIITHESTKLKGRYADFLKTRESQKFEPPVILSSDRLEITTDDERIVLYYIIRNSVRKVSKDMVRTWLYTDEIFEVNIDNAFDLLSSVGGGSVVDDTLELGIDLFRKYSANAQSLLTGLKEYVDQHRRLASDMFMKLWNANTLDTITLLFICYIVDERIESFGDRWMAEGQIRNIQQWEIKHSLDSTLSSNYGTSLQFLIQNNLVHESSWTSYGNPREYSLYPSIRNLLFNCPKGIQEALQTIKDKHYQDQELPF